MHQTHILLFVHVFSTSGWPWQRPTSCLTKGQELWIEVVTAPFRSTTTTFIMQFIICGHIICERSDITTKTVAGTITAGGVEPAVESSSRQDRSRHFLTS